IESPDFPGERLVVCRNPLVGEQRARKRGELLAATEKDLAHIQARVQRARNPLRGAAEIGQVVGAVLHRRKMAKHFQISMTDDAFSFSRDEASITAEAALDGIYVVRTSLPATHSDAASTVQAYKSLAGVERAFRSLKTVDLELRPVYHWTAPRVRARAALHVGLRSGVAYAPGLGADAVRRTRAGGTGCTALIAGGEGKAVTGSIPQGEPATHRRR